MKIKSFLLILLFSIISKFNISYADEEKMNLINFELQQRGLEINDKEMQYIFTHHSRDLNSLLNLAEKLDEISHQEKKSISINLIKKII